MDKTKQNSMTSLITVDSIFKSAGKPSARQVICLAFLALLRLNLALNFTNYVFIGRTVDFECVDNNGTGTVLNGCPNDSVEECESIVFEENTLVAEFQLVCDR